MNEPISISRDVTAVIIPDGEPVTLREGTSGFVTQALGGSFTIYVEGNLFRIAGSDADAIGMQPVAPPSLPAMRNAGLARDECRPASGRESCHHGIKLCLAI